MASFYSDSGRNGYRAQLYLRGVRRKLWIGPVSKSSARAICQHLDALNLARDTGTAVPAETRRWTDSVAPRIRRQLAAWGLLSQATPTATLPNALAAFCDAYIASRSDWKPRTLQRMQNVRRHLLANIPAQTTVDAVTAGDAERFARWCRAGFADSHAGKLISDARQFFEAAVKDRLIDANPFDGINTSQQHDADREAYVTPADAAALIAKATPYYAALIAAARFGGLRVPSEPLALGWSHVDWETGRFTVYAPKTGKRRLVPLFPELRPHLATLFDAAPDGAQFAFDRHRSTAAKTWRSNLLRIAGLAGVTPWPKLWQNMRASCRTDLLERFPGHVVDKWLGHSGKVGRKHYDRVHEGHFQAACGVAGGVAQAISTASDRSAE